MPLGLSRRPRQPSRYTSTRSRLHRKPNRLFSMPENNIYMVKQNPLHTPPPTRRSDNPLHDRHDADPKYRSGTLMERISFSGRAIFHNSCDMRLTRVHLFERFSQLPTFSIKKSATLINVMNIV